MYFLIECNCFNNRVFIILTLYLNYFTTVEVISIAYYSSTNIKCACLKMMRDP